ncbi:protein Mis18-alpha isoform X1 [Homo sapiens]|uniref:protein Mis18-alpha isoform X1 n=1 Tax=Homo sapiens TaxID=9606 RepID=UPI0007DC58E2|nr:protein Mis18-alpha isoform X1 [Homo sapiens]XP_054180643.1 protein Mis18-alpha isoform X1 [Homo sapiens]|eukprot:XP_016883889.1 protein Mis18-alpha isoform X1 [Homo sapiens]
MAGVRSLRCSRGCAGGCECGDKGKCSDSSLLGKRLSEDSSRHQLLQKWASMWSSMSEDASVADMERAQLEEEAAAAEERPLVFLCSGCRRPLGDSLSWVASQEDTNCILLRCVSCNVSVDKEQKLSKREKENGCVLETLCCAGCSLNLGYVYRCTPKNLDYKRDLFCLSVEAIEREMMPGAVKQILSHGMSVDLRLQSLGSWSRSCHCLPSRVLPTIIQEVVFQTLNRIMKSMA